MQNYLKTILNFRKNSKAIHEGETMHFAPVDGIYLISRKKDDETVLYIVNKNNSNKELSVERFSELGIDNMYFTEIYSGQKFRWKGKINLEKNSSIILRNY